MATVDYESGEAALAAAAHPPASHGGSLGGQVALRALLFAVTLPAIIVLSTSKQTVLVPVPQQQAAVPVAAKFQDSPALTYLHAALSETCFYTLATALRLRKFIKGQASSTAKIFFHLLLLDVLHAAVVASATGAAGSWAWIGLKGNSHTGWNKICDTYGKFCGHIGASVFLGLVASIILVLLSAINAHSLYRRSR